MRPGDEKTAIVLAMQDEMTALGLLPDPVRPWRRVGSLLTDRQRAHRWHVAQPEPVAAAPTPEDLEAIDSLIAGLAAALGRCEGCGEDAPGHTTDCTVRPGKLKPHGTYAAWRRHERRGEEPCEKCQAREVAAA